MKREHKNIRFKKDNFIQAIIYLETRQCYLAAAMDMSIKVYNHNLDKVSVSKELPDITIEERAINFPSLRLNDRHPCHRQRPRSTYMELSREPLLKGIKTQTLCT